MEAAEYPNKEVTLSGHQNQVNIHNYHNPFYTINGRPATAEDSYNMLVGRLESAEREIKGKDEVILSKDGQISLQHEQIALQHEIIRELRFEADRLRLEVVKLRECNKALKDLID